MLKEAKKGNCRNLGYTLSFIGPLVTISGNLAGGWWVSLNAILYLLIFYIIERISPENKNNQEGDGKLLPDTILVFHFFFQLLSFYSLFWSILNNNLNIFQFILAILSTSVNTGTSAIIIAHELIHRKKWIWQFMGRVLLFSAGNPYFFIDHIKVHHKHVGKTRDSATARRGESVYAFFTRSAAGQFKSSYLLEKERLKQKNFLERIFKNYVVRSVICTFLLLAFLMYIGGPILAFAHILHMYIANFLLEYINYIEHYGLTRQDGAKVNETHSWQSDRVISRFLLIDLSRHSDHHNYASKPYHKLISYDKSPVLPGGYLSVFYMVLFPKIWYNKIHPILDARQD